MKWSKWQELEDNLTPRACMDRRHAEMIKALLVSEAPESVVEIGCWNGYSTSAIAEAVAEQPAIKKVDVCDPTIQHGVIWVGSEILRAGVDFEVNAMHSVFYKGRPECWLIDGDHQHGALFDYEMARSRKPRIITVHDSHNPDVPPHWGAIEIAKRLAGDATVFWHDAKSREGELTHRGLAIGFFYQPAQATIDRLNAIAEAATV